MRSAICVAVLVAASTVAAQPKSEPSRLAFDVIASLRAASDGRKALAAETAPSGNPITESLNQMTAYRVAISKLRHAAQLLEPYTKSSSPLVSASATSMRGVYASLSRSFEGALSVQEKLVDVKPAEPLGPILSEASKHSAAASEAWKLLPVAVAGVAHSLVDSTRTTPEGRVGYLSITNAEKAALLKGIEMQFDATVSSGKATGLWPPDASAALFAGFLQQPWRGSDSK